MRTEPFAAGAHVQRQNAQNLKDLRTRLDTLNRQIATGRVSDTHAGLGPERGRALEARARIAQFESLQAGLERAATRARVLDIGLRGLDEAARTGLRLAETRDFADARTLPIAARNALGLALDSLNSQTDGRFLFAGTASDTPPVVGVATLLAGEPGRPGLEALVAERIAAETGVEPGSIVRGTGRLSLSREGDTITIARDPALPFGLRLTGAQAQAPFVAGLGDPQSTMTLASQPMPGTRLDLVVSDAFGNDYPVSLVAGRDFAIAGSPAQTLEAVESALTNRISDIAHNKLAAAARADVVDRFFSGNGTLMRPVGTPASGAGALAQGQSLAWYRGETGDGDPRMSAPVRVDTGSTIGLGARADETPFVETLKGLANLALARFDDSPAGRAAFSDTLAAATANLESARPGIALVATDIGLAMRRMSESGERHDEMLALMREVVAGIEEVDEAEAIVKALSLKVQLEAAYQVTASLAQLSLVNYLR